MGRGRQRRIPRGLRSQILRAGRKQLRQRDPRRLPQSARPFGRRHPLPDQDGADLDPVDEPGAMPNEHGIAAAALSPQQSTSRLPPRRRSRNSATARPSAAPPISCASLLAHWSKPSAEALPVLEGLYAENVVFQRQVDAAAGGLAQQAPSCRAVGPSAPTPSVRVRCRRRCAKDRRDLPREGRHELSSSMSQDVERVARHSSISNTGSRWRARRRRSSPKPCTQESRRPWPPAGEGAAGFAAAARQGFKARSSSDAPDTAVGRCRGLA